MRYSELMLMMMSGGGAEGVSAQVDIYSYGDGNTSSLQLGESFTGNFKGWIAGTSSTGVNPDLLAIIDGAWQDTTDLDNPTWNKFNGDVTDLTYIVDSTFVGYVPMYAKDGVWIDVDMGEYVPTTYNVVYNSDNVVYGSDNVVYEV